MYVVSSLVFYTELASSSVVDGAWFRESRSRVEVLIFELSSQILMLCFLQVDKYETGPHFFELTQNLTSDCWLI